MLAKEQAGWNVGGGGESERGQVSDQGDQTACPLTQSQGIS